VLINLVVFVLMILLGGFHCAFAAGAMQQSSFIPEMEEWLRQPDRKDFDWSVRLSKPSLTFQQRYLIEITAAIPTEGLEMSDSKRKLIGIVAVGDDEGHWLKQEQAPALDIPASLSGKQVVQYVSGIYLRSGNYVVALAVSDPIFGKRNLWRGRVRVPAPPGREFPKWEQHFPQVEFAGEVPDSIWPRGPRSGAEIWPLAHPLSRIPLSGTGPVQIDLVVAGAKAVRRGAGIARLAGNLFLPSSMGMALQAGSLLSLLEPDGGCTRVSVVDYRQNRIFMDREEARAINWDSLQNEIWSSGTNVVDQRELARWNQPAAVLKEELNAILTDRDDCGTPGPKRQHSIVLVAYQIYPRRGTEPIILLDAKLAANCRFFYFRAGYAGDQIEDLLKPVRPRIFNFYTPADLAKSLNRFLSEIGMRQRK
jgi:hypothetical protein